MSEFFKQLWQIILDSNLLNLLAAVLVLLIGWLIAVILSGRTTRILNKLTNSNHQRNSNVSGKALTHIGSFSGKAVFYLIMIITLLGCFSLLKLHGAAAPLQEFVMQIIAYLPRIAGALLLALAAWILAGIVRSAVRMIMQKNRLHEKLAHSAANRKTAENIADYTAQTAAYTVWLFFLPGILNALGIYGVTQALQNMFFKFFAYLPNLIAAGFILLAGFWAAQIVRKAVHGLVEASRIQNLLQDLPFGKELKSNTLAICCSTAAYILIAIPILIAALNALKITVLSQTIAAFLEQLLASTGNIIGAIIIAILSLMAAHFCGKLITGLTAAWGLDKVTANLWKNRSDSITASVIAGKIAMLTLMLFGLIAICDILNFESLAKLLKTFAVFGGNLIISMIVVTIGLYLAEFSASLVRDKWNKALVSMLKSVVIIFTLALAVSNIDLGDGIVEIAFTLLLGAAAVAFAIAFGIGGKTTAEKLLESWMEKMKK